MPKITTHYLEMNSLTELMAKSVSNGLVVQECEIKQFQVN